MGQYYKSLVFGNDRILLYLLDATQSNDDLEKSSEVPSSITAQEIADAVLIERHHISKQLTKLKSHDQIIGLTKRIKGKKRRQTAYILTSEGKKAANKIKQELKKLEITILDPGKKSHKVKFSKVSKFLLDKELGRKLSDLETCKFTNSKGVLDVENILGSSREFIDFTKDALEPAYFYGRVQELAQLKTWIAGKKTHKLILIYGIAGIGKTTLASKLIEDYKGSKHLFWYSINNWDTVRSLLFHLSEFLSNIEDGRRSLYIDFDRPLELDKILKYLQDKLDGLNGLFILDDFHKANEDLRGFIISILEILDKIDGLKIMMLTRYIIPFYDQRKVKLHKTIAELEVEGLDYESSKEILRRKGLPQARYKDIYNVTSGSPLLLEIVDSSKTSKRYIYEEIFSQLSDQEQKIMEIISTNQIPIPYDAFFIDKNIMPETIENLVQKLLIRETVDGLYDTHEFIREFFYKRLSPHTKIDYHKYCAEFNRTQEKPLNYLEAIFHYIKSFQYQQAIESSIAKSDRIISCGLSERFLSVLEEIPEDEIALSEWNEFLILKGNLCFALGEFEKSLEYYNHAIEVSTELGNDSTAAKAYCEIGHIYEEQNLFNEALTNFDKGLKLSIGLNDQIMTAEAKRGIGRVHWRVGDYKTAEKYYQECLRALKKIDNPKILGAIYIDLGNIYLSTFNELKAIKYLNQALHQLEKIKDQVELARVYNSIAAVYSNKGNFKEAIVYYKKLWNIIEMIGETRLSGYGWGNIGYCYAKLGRIPEAKSYVNRAKEIYDKTHNENMLFQILRTEALIGQHFQDWDSAIDNFQKSIAIVEKLNVQYLLTQTLSELGELYLDKGDTTNADLYFNKAQEIKSNILKLE